MKILMAGCGKMGGAMLRRWSDGEFGRFTVVDPAEVPTPGRVRHVRSLEAIASERFDLLVVAIKPQMMEDVLPAYARLLSDRAFALSIAAGVTGKRIERLLGGVPVVRVMPNLPAALGRGMAALHAGENVGPAERAYATRLVGATGEVAWLEEEGRLDLFTALAGSGPGYVFEMMRGLQEVAQAKGFTATEARKIAVETFAGAAELARQDERPLEALRDDVTSPGGTTDAGLTALRHDGTLHRLLAKTVEAAHERAVELR